MAPHSFLQPAAGGSWRQAWEAHRQISGHLLALLHFLGLHGLHGLHGLRFPLSPIHRLSGKLKTSIMKNHKRYLNRLHVTMQFKSIGECIGVLSISNCEVIGINAARTVP